MANMIVTYVAIAGMFLLSFAIYAFVVGMLLPKIFLRPSYRKYCAQDRGIKKYTYEGGRAIVYQPAMPSNKYIEQYILSLNNGEKFLKCKVDSRVYMVIYDVVCFNGNGKVIDTLTVKDPVINDCYTEAIALDYETAYVNVIVKKANGATISKKPTVQYSSASLTVYAILSAIYSLVQMFLFKATMFFAMDRLYYHAEQFSNGGVVSTTLMRIAKSFFFFFDTVGVSGDIAIIVITLIFSLTCSLLMILFNLSSNKGIRNDSLICALVKKIVKSVKGVRYGSKSTANIKRFLSVFASK